MYYKFFKKIDGFLYSYNTPLSIRTKQDFLKNDLCVKYKVGLWNAPKIIGSHLFCLSDALPASDLMDDSSNGDLELWEVEISGEVGRGKAHLIDPLLIDSDILKTKIKKQIKNTANVEKNIFFLFPKTVLTTRVKPIKRIK